MNNRKLSLIFLILLVVWGMTKHTSQDKIRNFKTDLINIDTAQVTIIKIAPKGAAESEITLQRNTTSMWLATKGTVTVPADREAINSFLNNIQLIKTKKVAAKKKEKWSHYEVDEKNGTRIKIYAGSQLLEDFVVGRFSFNEETSQGLSFVRISKGEEVYAIDGSLSSSLGRGFDAYRNKKLLKLSEDDITALALTNEHGEVRSFTKKNNQWLKEGSIIDSVGITSYLTGLENVLSSKFVDDIDPTTYSIPKYRILAITNNNSLQPIRITSYRDEAKTPPYIIQSSENVNAYFSSEVSGLFKKIFSDLESL